MAIPKSAKYPVLAHLFLNYMLDNKVAYGNFYNFNGYQPPLNSIDIDRLLGDAFPESLPDAIVGRRTSTAATSPRAGAQRRRDVARGLARVPGRCLTELRSRPDPAPWMGRRSRLEPAAATEGLVPGWFWPSFSLPATVWLPCCSCSPSTRSSRSRSARSTRLPHGRSPYGTRCIGLLLVQLRAEPDVPDRRHLPARVPPDDHYVSSPRREPADRVPGRLLHRPATAAGSRPCCWWR